MELSEELVEQVSGGGGVTVTVFSPAPIVLAGGLVVGSRGKGPHPADVGEPVVLDMTVSDGDRSPGCPGDWCTAMRPPLLVETAMGKHALALLAALDSACANVDELGQASAELFQQHPD